VPFLTSLDGKVYELDEETLAKYRIGDEEVQKLALIPPLHAPSAESPPVSGAAQQGVVVRQGSDGSTIIEITPGGT